MLKDINITWGSQTPIIAATSLILKNFDVAQYWKAGYIGKIYTYNRPTMIINNKNKGSCILWKAPDKQLMYIKEAAELKKGPSIDVDWPKGTVGYDYLKEAYTSCAPSMCSPLPVVRATGSAYSDSYSLFLAWKGMDYDRNIYLAPFSSPGSYRVIPIVGEYDYPYKGSGLNLLSPNTPPIKDKEGKALSTNNSPSICIITNKNLNSSKLHLVWRNVQDNINNGTIGYSSTLVSSIDKDHRNGKWETQVLLKDINGNQFYTIDGPSLATERGQLALAWVTPRKTIKFSHSFDGINWVPELELKGSDGEYFQTNASPAIYMYGRVIYVAWKGKDNDNQIYISASDDGKNWSTKAACKTPEGSILSSDTPALFVDNEGVHLAWKNSSPTADATIWQAKGNHAA